jgi:hypothetical protein
MKPIPHIENGLRTEQTARRFPATDWHYHSVDLGRFKARCGDAPSLSFTQISRDYFNTEARRSVIFESVWFGLIIITVIPAMLDCGRALLEFTQAIGAV